MYFINLCRVFSSSSDPAKVIRSRDDPVKTTKAGFTLLRGTSGLVFAGAILSLVACVAPNSRPVLTENQQESAYIGGLTLARFWGDEATPEVKALITNQYLQIRNAACGGVRSESVRHADYLAISGGGANGAFGAGFLVGWGKRGDRPEFEVVTGVSTGALAAPFAFLGSKYDRQLRQIYTEYGDKDILRSRGILGVLGPSLNDNTPLRNLIARYVTEDVVAAIASEYQIGRRLLVQTTNIDAQRPVIWDISAICASPRMDRRDLVVQILLASAALPAVFPPVRLPVKTASGKVYDELHVDGGVSAQVFFAPPNIDFVNFEWIAFGRPRVRNLYVIRNGRLSPVYANAIERTLPLAQRAIETLTRYQGVADLNRLEVLATKANGQLFFASVPNNFTGKPRSSFDNIYMRSLFAIGYEAGYARQWQIGAPATPILAGGGLEK